MYQLYPFKFKPILKDKIWGGEKLQKVLNKNIGKMENCGESWEISAVEGDVSVVANGYLEGNSIEELIEVYMGDLVGDQVFEKFGQEFPLLLKFIDATADLSVQVHPNDAIAKERHSAFGKTEMWYVVDADEGAQLISGFKKDVQRNEYLKHVENKTLKEIMNYEDVKAGDVFFIPAGRIHAIGTGILLAEIQQTSDVTYRIYDWDRKDAEGNERELHTDLAVDVLDYNLHKNYRTDYIPEVNKSINLASCKYFNTNLIQFTDKVEKEFIAIDSFVVYMCIEGDMEIVYGDEIVPVSKGETVLIPAEIKNIQLVPKTQTKVLEVYIPELADKHKN